MVLYIITQCKYLGRPPAIVLAAAAAAAAAGQDSFMDGCT